MLYERTVRSRKPAEDAELEIANLRAGDTLTADLVSRDPYLFDFLGWKGSYSEKDLAVAIRGKFEQFTKRLVASTTAP